MGHFEPPVVVVYALHFAVFTLLKTKHNYFDCWHAIIAYMIRITLDFRRPVLAEEYSTIQNYTHEQ